MSALLDTPLSRPILRLWTEDEVEQFKPPDEKAHRTSDPVMIWTLRNVLNRLQAAWPHSCKDGTWRQYSALVNHWERFWNGAGPEVSKVSPAELLAFFESVEEWGTRRSWEKNLVLLTKLFKSACRASHRNKEGVPREIQAPISFDDVPFITIPEEDWFRANRQPGKHRTGGHTPKRRSTLTLEDFQKVIDACWTCPGIKDPVYWETVHAWIWFSGMRIDQVRSQLRWCTDGKSEGIDLQSQSIYTHEPKCGGEIVFPLAPSLMPGLLTLFQRKKRSQFQPYVFYQWGLTTPHPFYAIWKRIWEHALPCSNAAEREHRHFLPHELRSVSTTNWDMRPDPDNKAGWMITGHKPADVRTAAYFVPGDERLKQIVQRFPMPKLWTPRLST
ncbi:site-specific integrase [Schlesneria paludicola]|uniref:hypothetical protein n=1 Tax=Schlesneria paludicola TaxID=360056 RepID=UPI00029B165C|nr:hypothetical protein [Schlesneria paludicola]